MLPWLIPISLFWTLAALYLGGAKINIEGGGGGRQMSGLLLLFTAFLVIYGVFRMILGGPVGPTLGGVVLPVLAATISLPFVAKLTFRVVGVRITAASSGEAH